MKFNFKNLKTKIIWNFPKKNNLLILDHVGSEKIEKCLLGHKEYTILYTRREYIYLPILILSLLFYYKFKENSYRICFIKYVNPKVILTLIHTSYKFSYLMKYFNKIKFIIAMNGKICSSEINKLKIFGMELKIDYFFCINYSIANQLNNLINGKVITSGHIVCNTFVKPKFKSIKKIQFLSRVKPHFWIYDQIFDKNAEYQKRNNQFYINEISFLLKFLNSYCEKNNLELEIIPKTNDYISELNFYKKIIKNFCFKKRNADFKFAYNEMSDNAIIVSDISTLGLEAFSMGYRTAFFTMMDSFLPKNHFHRSIYDLNWEAFEKYEKKGFFWSNELDENHLKIVLQNLIDVDEYDWQKQIDLYKNLNVYFPNNKKIQSILNEFDIKTLI